MSSSQADTRDNGDYAALAARLKEMTGWDDSARWPAGALPEVGPFDRRVIVIGGMVFAVLMALSGRYGFDRDELYFLDCARHLQASYVDQPVLGPLFAWVSLKLFGVSLSGLRVWPALAAWATVVVGGLTAREFGGGRRAAPDDRPRARLLTDRRPDGGRLADLRILASSQADLPTSAGRSVARCRMCGR